MKKRKTKLDADEQALLDSFDKGEWKSAKNLKAEIDFAKKAARNTLRKKCKNK